jgi:acyl phosphate:glycerol-3-phosphate acyltransferase
MPHPLDWSLALPGYVVALAIGYLLGSIPFGLIITRLAGTADIRTIGSGNIGATNVLRTGRKGLAAATLVGDALKGTIAVLVTYRLYGQDPAVLAAIGAFLGHVFPIWLKFKGGKGVATYIGILLAFAWPAVIAFAVIWLAVAAITRYSSLSALIASAAMPVVVWLSQDVQDAQLFLLLTAMLWFTHRANIGRLMRGTEPKIGASTPTARSQVSH